MGGVGRGGGMHGGVRKRRGEYGVGEWGGWLNLI